MDNGDLLSLLGSLITAYIALNIFGKWKSQKGSEVISIHAKEIFILIEELPKHEYCNGGYACNGCSTKST